jgi:xanthine dehydrogenase YagS FAD-binding subunit
MRHSPRSHYLKVRERASYEFVLVSVAACLELAGRDKTVRSARIVLGGVAYKPWRARAAEQELLEKPLTPQTVAAADTTQGVHMTR